MIDDLLKTDPKIIKIAMPVGRGHRMLQATYKQRWPTGRRRLAAVQ